MFTIQYIVQYSNTIFNVKHGTNACWIFKLAILFIAQIKLIILIFDVLTNLHVAPSLISEVVLFLCFLSFISKCRSPNLSVM